MKTLFTTALLALVLTACTSPEPPPPYPDDILMDEELLQQVVDNAFMNGALCGIEQCSGYCDTDSVRQATLNNIMRIVR
jgi:hypothetical protein